jgi:hypothetical protein
MKAIAAGVAGALISGVAMYAVGAKAAQPDAFAQGPASVQPALVQTDPQYIPATYTTALRPVAAGSIATSPAPVVTPVHNPVRTQQRRASSPQRTVNRQVYDDRNRQVYDDREIARQEDVRQDRTWGKTAMVIGGSAAGGAGVGGLLGGAKGAMIGAAIGGGAASIYEAGQRR